MACYQYVVLNYKYNIYLYSQRHLHFFISEINTIFYLSFKTNVLLVFFKSYWKEEAKTY